MPARTVLILDDNPEFVRAVSLAAEAAGLAVSATEDPDTFAGLLRGDGIAAAIVDCLLGDRSGLPILAAIGEASPRLPTLVVSGYGEALLSQAGQVARAHGLQHVTTLQKPFGIAELRGFLMAAAAETAH